MNTAPGHTPLKLRFFGVRGSIPTPAKACMKAGGNTPCLLLQWREEAPVIIDAGTGLRAFGQTIETGAKHPFAATVLFSHFHWDHIQGFPFFPPIYASQTQLRLVASCTEGELKDTLRKQMTGPYFPVSFDRISADCHYQQLMGPQGITIGSLQVKPIELNHPGGATGFRIESPHGSMVYVSDHEHGDTRIDQQIVERSAGADLMIYDAHFTPEEYRNHAGWGHSTWQAGAEMARAAGVRQYALFHHNPNRTDNELAEILQQSRRVFECSFVAAEGETISVSEIGETKYKF